MSCPIFDSLNVLGYCVCFVDDLNVGGTEVHVSSVMSTPVVLGS